MRMSNAGRLDTMMPSKRRRDTWLVVPAGVVLAVLAVVMGLGFANHESKSLLLLPIFGIVAAISLVLGLSRFVGFVAGVLVLRASLDYVKVGQGSGNGLDPAAVLAMGFLLAAVLWLLSQRLAGDHPIRSTGYSPLVVPLAILLGASALSAAAAPDLVRALVELARITAAVSMFFILDQLIRRNTPKTLLLGAIYASAIVPLLVGAYQSLSRSSLVHKSLFDRVHGTFLHPNPFGIYLTLLIVMGVAIYPHLDRRWRLPLGVIVGASLVMLVATYTRTAWIATVVALMLVGLLQSQRLLVGLLVGIMVLLIAVPSVISRFSDLEHSQQTQSTEAGNSFIWRIRYWEDAMKFTTGKKITGIGLAQVREETNQGKELHNDFLRSFVEGGVVGLVAYCGLIAAFIVAARRRLRETFGTRGLERGLAVGFAGCLLAFVMISLVSNVISQVVLLWYFLGFAAIATSVPTTTASAAEPVGSRATHA